MRSGSNDWDRDEREALEGLEDQIEAMQSRHRGDPPLDLLRAARGGALPDDLQSVVSQRLAESPLSQALLDDAEHGEEGLEPRAVTRLLAGITARAARERRTTTSQRWFLPALAGSALAVGVPAVWVAQRPDPVSSSRPEPEATVAGVAPGPAFQLPLERPDVRLSMAALTWRGSAAENRLLVDLKPALDAFRAADYQTADREFAALESRYPGTIEVRFYQGVARLFLGDTRGAIEALTAAEAIADPAFIADVAWYRAVAEERAGSPTGARARLDSLCRNGGTRSSQACDALSRLETAVQPSPR